MFQFDSKKIPSSPGVYIFKDENSVIVYVGKAKNLKSRVSSYFINNQDRLYKKHLMVDAIFDIETISTNSEKEALILESNLIKNNSPKFNVLLKDNSEYCFVKIGKGKFDKYSQVSIIRKKTEEQIDDLKTTLNSIKESNLLKLKDSLKNQKPKNKTEESGFKYFGPYTSKKDILNILDNISKVFPYKCLKLKIKTKQDNELSPCFNFYIKKCPGICCNKCSVDEYEDNVKNVANFLNGKNKDVLEYLNSKMKEFSDKKNYEVAAQYRDKIVVIEKISNKQFVRNIDNKSVDIVSIFKYADLACVNLFNIRNGVLLGKRNFILKNVVRGFVFEDQDRECESVLMEKFISSYYLNTLEGVNIVTQYEVDSSIMDINKNILSIKKPVNEKQKSLIELGEKNAIEFINKNQINGKNLERIKERLELDRIPKRIECYDISNISGSFAVGSMTVFVNGLPAKDQYRKFKIKNINFKLVNGEPNDFAMMEEVLQRRLSDKNLQEWGWPDLIVLDGGLPQLSTVLKLIEKLKTKNQKLKNINLVSLAKREEEVYVPQGDNGVKLVQAKSLYILRQIRDEAHRFGIGYFRKLYRKQFLK